MENVKNSLLILLMVVVVVFGLMLYNDHKILASMAEINSEIKPDTEIAEEYSEDESASEGITSDEYALAESEYEDNGNVYYYLESGKTLDDNSNILMWCFLGEDDGINITNETKEKITKMLIDSEDYWDDYVKENGTLCDFDTYDGENDIYTSDWLGMTYSVVDAPSGFSPDTYSPPTVRWVTPHYGTIYYSISTDNSSLVKWKVRKDSEEKIEITYFTRIKKGDLMPKGINDDFMYE